MTRVQSKFAIINEMWSKNMIWYELKMILKGTLTASTASKVKKLRPLMGSEISFYINNSPLVTIPLTFKRTILLPIYNTNDIKMIVHCC